MNPGPRQPAQRCLQRAGTTASAAAVGSSPQAGPPLQGLCLETVGGADLDLVCCPTTPFSLSLEARQALFCFLCPHPTILSSLEERQPPLGSPQSRNEDLFKNLMSKFPAGEAWRFGSRSRAGLGVLEGGAGGANHRLGGWVLSLEITEKCVCQRGGIWRGPFLGVSFW